ncbi:MAG: class F sortase [Anaerolineales bacterium]|nr:class F sortase [Anaerolineales bacterium]
MKSVKSNIFTVAVLLALVFSSTVTVSPARALSDTPLATMPTANGEVRTIVPDGAGGVYIGGNFTQLMPAGGGPAVTRNYIARINADGSIHPWNPDANGAVNVIAVSGNTVYAGGGFTAIGGQARNRIAALDATVNTNNATAWNPDASDRVRTLAVSGNTVYVGGFFTTIGGQTRNRIAALDATVNTNNATAWNPNANALVYTLVVSGNTVYAGGLFTAIGGQARNRIAALDATVNTNNATAWNPDANYDVYALAVSGNTIYAGGGFTNIGGQARNFIAALDATIDTNNATAWNPNANGHVLSLAVSGNTIYTGGGFIDIGGQARNFIAALDATTSNATAWNPNANGAATTFMVSGNTVYMGGQFTTVGGNARSSFAAFSLDTTAPTIASHTLQASYTGAGPSSFTVTFSEDVYNPTGDTDTDDVTNANNYVLVEQGSASGFQTTACNAIDAINDTRVTPSGVTYIPNTAIVNLGSALPAGTYRLFVCGTTSIVDLGGNELNGGTDFTFDFTVGAATASTTTESTRASALPKTGFAPNKVTNLSAQPANLEYAKLGDLVLEIPSLNVKSTIVGVPQNKDKTWDVTWLGNDTGWLNGTAFPTWNGNSVLTAHVTNASGLDGPFAALKTLKYGDQVIVHLGGVKYVYEVRETKLSRPYATNYTFESKQDASYLTLVTCSGYSPLNESYLFRRVVRAVLIEVK